MEEELITIQEACKLLNISDQTLAKLRKAGKVKDVYPHGRPEPGTGGKQLVRISKNSILEMLER